MKRLFVFVVAGLSFTNASAQSVSFHKDTIFSGKTKLAIWKQGTKKPVRYAIFSLDGKQLADLHDGRVDINGEPGYVFTFLNDGKKCMVVKDAAFPKSLQQEIVRKKLIVGPAINDQSEAVFLKAHPLPQGYIDVEELSEGDRVPIRRGMQKR